jgi:hypothetical protein
MSSSSATHTHSRPGFFSAFFFFFLLSIKSEPGERNRKTDLHFKLPCDKKYAEWIYSVSGWTAGWPRPRLIHSSPRPPVNKKRKKINNFDVWNRRGREDAFELK